MSKIICISRQFGSKGHFIAKKFAESVCIPYYDKHIIDQAPEISGINSEILQKADEKTANPFLQPIYYEGFNNEYYGMNANDILFAIQKKIILECAKKSDCVIVGRCADYILREYKEHSIKSIFMSAPMELRIKNTMEIDTLTEKEASVKIRKSDKARSEYCNYYSGRDWGKPSNYDLCINTSNNDNEIIELMRFIYSNM